MFCRRFNGASEFGPARRRGAGEGHEGSIELVKTPRQPPGLPRRRTIAEARSGTMSSSFPRAFSQRSCNLRTEASTSCPRRANAGRSKSPISSLTSASISLFIVGKVSSVSSTTASLGGTLEINIAGGIGTRASGSPVDVGLISRVPAAGAS